LILSVDSFQGILSVLKYDPLITFYHLANNQSFANGNVFLKIKYLRSQALSGCLQILVSTA